MKFFLIFTTMLSFAVKPSQAQDRDEYLTYCEGFPDINLVSIGYCSAFVSAALQAYELGVTVQSDPSQAGTDEWRRVKVGYCIAGLDSMEVTARLTAFVSQSVVAPAETAAFHIVWAAQNTYECN